MSLKNLRQIDSFEKVGADCQLLLTMLSPSKERINRDKAVTDCQAWKSSVTPAEYTMVLPWRLAPSRGKSK